MFHSRNRTPVKNVQNGWIAMLLIAIAPGLVLLVVLNMILMARSSIHILLKNQR